MRSFGVSGSSFLRVHIDASYVCRHPLTPAPAPSPSSLMSSTSSSISTTTVIVAYTVSSSSGAGPNGFQNASERCKDANDGALSPSFEYAVGSLTVPVVVGYIGRVDESTCCMAMPEKASRWTACCSNMMDFMYGTAEMPRKGSPASMDKEK